MIEYPVISEIGDRVYAINEYGLDMIYVILGTKRALVIDTGAGCVNLRAAVRRLTFLPYDVVLTHGHGAQAGGMGQFESIFAYPGEYEGALSVTIEENTRFCNSAGEQKEIWKKAVPQKESWKNIPSFTELWDGTEFDLGGRQVITVRTSGHTLGSCSFIDNKSRIAFTGDGCCRDLDITECCVTSAYRGLRNLHGHRKEFDRICPAWTGCASATMICSLPTEILDCSMALCREVVCGRAEFTYAKDRGGVHMAEFSGVRLYFQSDRLYEEEEAHLL